MKFKTIAIAITSGLLLAGSAYTQQTPSTSDQDKANTKPADNTGKNAQDRSDDALTSGDQKNSKEDVDLTRKIRRAITKTDGLSVNAKNVKIITKEGKVTLRGPVKSADEKEQIVKIAKETEGVSSVDNQLEVKEQATRDEK